MRGKVLISGFIVGYTWQNIRGVYPIKAHHIRKCDEKRLTIEYLEKHDNFGFQNVIGGYITVHDYKNIKGTLYRSVSPVREFVVGEVEDKDMALILEYEFEKEVGL